MPDYSTISAINTSTNVLTTAAAHGLNPGDAIGFWAGPEDTGVYPTATPSIARYGVYYACPLTITTLTVYADLADVTAGVGGPNLLLFSDSGTGVITLAKLSIRERIERDVINTLAAIQGIGNVERFDGDRNAALGNLAAVLVVEDELFEELAALKTSKTMPCWIDLHIQRSEDDPQTLSELMSRWLALMENALTADPQRSGLAVWTRATGSTRPPIEANQPEVTITLDIEIDYRHKITDAFAPGS